MALIPRVNVKADAEDPQVSAALTDLGLISERLTGSTTPADLVLSDPREREAFHGMALARLRRFGLNSSATVSRHNCPHTVGAEETEWSACTDPQYGFTTEAA